MGLTSRYFIDISGMHKSDEDLVGKKAYDFGMLWKLGVPFPNGFVITTQFRDEFFKKNNINNEIEKLKALNHPSLSNSVEELFEPARVKIMHTHIPQSLAFDLHKFYKRLAGKFRETSVNMFSSSKTDKFIFFLNIKGDANIVLKIKTIWSSFLNSSTAIIVFKNIESEKNGKIFTNQPIVNKNLSEEQIDKLIKYCKIIQNYFYFPKEIEYAINKSKIYITKINPFTGIVNESFEQVLNHKKQRILAKGVSLNSGIATGSVRVLCDDYKNIKVRKGEIIVLPKLKTSLFKSMKNAKAVIVDTILPNSLSKTLYRKAFQIPTVEGVRNATKMLQNGNVVTVNGINGEIYSGGLIY